MRRQLLSEMVDDYIEDTLTSYLRLVEPQSLTQKETLELFIKMKNGDSSVRNILIEKHLWLVVKIVNLECFDSKVELLDLIQAGNIGLMKAIEKYDLSKETNFVAYATWWIFSNINLEVNYQSPRIYIPYKHAVNLDKIKKTINNLEFRLMRMPTIEEIAKETLFSKKEIVELMSYEKMLISYHTKIDESLAEEILDGLSLEDTVIDEISLKLDVRNFLGKIKLTPKQERVLKLRFGIDQEYSMTYQEIEKVLTNLTFQAVENMEKKVLRKLIINYTKELRHLALYLDYPDRCINNLEAKKKVLKTNGKTIRIDM